MSLTTQAGDNVTKNRNKYVGGSDIPTILGINKYKTKYELAQEKLGITKSEFKGNEYTEYGNIMEPQIRDYINAVEMMSFKEQTKKDDQLGIRSNTDGFDAGASVILEIKTHGKTPTMEAYKVQMQLYMYQFDVDVGWLALYERPKDFDAEFDNQHLKIQTVKRDDDYINKILAAVKEFWEACDYLRNNPGASEHDFNNFIKGDEIVATSTAELQVKTLKFEPAKVEFNYKELEAILEENLKKYNGLTFTEDDVAECKKTIAELRKGKKAVDSYRLDTKKKLTKSVTDFENQCKQLNKKFDEVLTPLVEQSDQFEEKRKDEKRVEIQAVIDQLVEDEELNEKYAAELVIEDSYLNKGKAMKAINEELSLKAQSLGFKQAKYLADEENIVNTVKLANAEYKINLTESAYVRLLEFKEVGDIKRQILDDSHTEVEKQLEKQKKEVEVKEVVAEIVTPVQAPEEDEPTYFEVYKVTGTESQLEALESFMKHEQIEFEIEEEK
ncbi:DUF1351 domain-containing protein [Virgibacillus sp. C22-A2]|uniref:DUF1351 domain-containing protein n=1 Tax=Virgibacillus tibetensis TaxID=3042313 RepID=A0ABU6KAS3_9BACI|nr:DUF1351 domain-containing protein [Virgibacillus sp. C22-A2]